ncbi:hypothetical protein PBY51_012453 [Eleginops maclovinus]|uniref:Uncharacterized protein n=1 Tax=Eleginops maclovinus TaxID=56733 RepID=A0AAN7XQ95_ELEMC|nr:hypothetical protein PBY51_012453 [Eleginops maclovinus]
MGHQSRDYYYGHSDAKTLPLPPGPPSAHQKMNLKRSDGKKYPHDVTMSPAPAYTGKIKSKMFQNLKAMRGGCSPMEVDPPQKRPNRMSQDVMMSPAPAYTGKIKSKMFRNQKAMRGRCSPMEVDRDVEMSPAAAVFNTRNTNTFQQRQPRRRSPMEVNPAPKRPKRMSRNMEKHPAAAAFNTRNTNTFQQRQPRRRSPKETCTVSV